MDFNNIMNPQSIDNETSGIQTTQSSTLRRCIRSKWTWIIFAILIILTITIPITFILIKKENPQETSTIVTTEESLLTTEGISMPMKITSTTLPLITQTRTCDGHGCRARIAYYFPLIRVFGIQQFELCNGCPYFGSNSGRLNFSSAWSMGNTWTYQDFFIKNSNGQDCEKNPIESDVTGCMMECLIDATCVGFSRQKNIEAYDRKGICWLKTNITVNQIPDDPEWYTAVFNPTSLKK